MIFSDDDICISGNLQKELFSEGINGQRCEVFT